MAKSVTEAERRGRGSVGRLQRQADQARTLMVAQRWSEAAGAFEQLALKATERGDRATAQQAWALSGDALRRDDRVAAATRALRRALDLLSGSDEAALSRRAVGEVELASVLVQAGAIEAGATLCFSLLARPLSVNLRCLALDGLCGARLLQGRLGEAEGAVAQLERICPKGALPALWFRAASCASLGGDLDRADQHLAQILAESPESAEWAGPRAAAAEERGELALRRGLLAEAAWWLDLAGRGWTAAGRRSGLYRVESALLRIALCGEALPLGSALEGPLAYARDRGLMLLEIELRRVRGAARCRLGLPGMADLDLAVLLAERCGALLLEGQARFTRARIRDLWSDRPRMTLCLAVDRLATTWLSDPARAPW